jgi:hypothetical protein
VRRHTPAPCTQDKQVPGSKQVPEHKQVPGHKQVPEHKQVSEYKQAPGNIHTWAHRVPVQRQPGRPEQGRRKPVNYRKNLGPSLHGIGNFFSFSRKMCCAGMYLHGWFAGFGRLICLGSPAAGIYRRD